MAKGFGIHGSTTDHGGMVLSTQSTSSQKGSLFLRAGDGFACPKCKSWSTLIQSNSHIIFDSKPVAYVGDKFTCGATLMPKQAHVVGDSGGSFASAAIANLQVVNTQQNNLVNNFNRSEEQYENYYIEQNKTNYVKFINILLPYDPDKKGLGGLLIQAASGACEFIVTYTVQEKELFVTVSFIPPTLKGEAKIFPSASLKIYREKNREFKFITSKNLEKKAGYWSTEKGKEPVGFCKIALPEPNLSLMKVVLEMGYEARLDGGKVVPNPSYVTHTFTLNSAERLVK
jgi:uncharacterized Zn-binding protein involved in type VI secretion